MLMQISRNWDAGTAFEAYLVPTGAEGYQEVSVSGTETTYTDKAFLSSAFAGLMQASLCATAGHAHQRCTQPAVGAAHQQADQHAYGMLHKPS